MKKQIISALILMGFTSLVVQTLLIREFLITFYGNELTIGLILACWIISEALGSSVASRFSDKTKSPTSIYAFLQVLISLYLPISIFLIRTAKNILTTVPGESVGIVPICISSLFIIGPLSIFDGMQFPLGCRIYSEYSKKKGQASGKVYIFEAMGFILAGPIVTYAFLTRNSFQIGLLIALINLISGLWLIQETTSSLLKKALSIFIFILISLNLYALFSNSALKIHNYSIARQWKNQNIIEYKNSLYGNLAISQRKEQYTFYSDGIPIINIPAPDIIWTEELVHFGMLSHPNPRKVLFISGGVGGPINEILKHSIDRIDYTELDPYLIKLIKKFPNEITEKELNNQRVHLEITDGVHFVKRAHSKYDIIFINLPLPSTLQLNRYYTKEFFNQIKTMLLPSGELILNLPGSLRYLNEELKRLNLCILLTLKEVFPYTSIIPGDNNIYISSCGPLEITPEIFISRIKQRKIFTKTLTQSHLEYRLQTYWQEWFYQNLAKTSLVNKNYNLAPSAVFYGISYWNSLFNPYLKGFFRSLNKVNFTYLVIYLIIFEIILLIIKTFFVKLKNIGIGLSIATTGFVGMSFYLIFILAYQVFFGYIYYHIALLTTSFMAGLTMGGMFITKNLERIKNDLLYFVIMEISIALFCIGSVLFLGYLNNVKEFGGYYIFYTLSGLSGFLVGAEFPMANKLYWQDKTYIKTAGILYAFDLFGAFLSALLVPIISIPIFGILKTCLFLAILKIAGLIVVQDI
ncbi:MAG: hypothetical protein NC828_01300 [Candidatus Omnitrophica bacterium]|nr:hypothetical protein [Candidatus Omnitrophota bacterium]